MRHSERSSLAHAGLQPINTFGPTGPGWLTVMIDANFKNQLYAGKLADHDPLDTSLES
ncbi:hypothetical protein [Kribbella solani]|uniref:hypothetical protein n=1 Tax=Kribbella solani TaxID=236067 RepID=UPI0029A3F3A8|nr:hypothetical protein [Kribbella solani]MDX2972605.1 hypothetical protein [Kribbella solani]